MKKTLIAAAAAVLATAGASAQVIEEPSFFDNFSIGLDGGVTTPMHNNAFFGSMRGVAGLHIGKQITPVFGVGVESAFAVNTSSWKGMPHSSTAFDNSYVGVYGTADLFNLFGGISAVYVRSPSRLSSVPAGGTTTMPKATAWTTGTTSPQKWA